MENDENRQANGIPPPPPLTRTIGNRPYVERQGTIYYIRKNENNSDMITYNGNEYWLEFDPTTRERFIRMNNNRIVFRGAQGGRTKRKRSKRRRTRKHKK
jgi:hypothetical protein